MRHGKAPTPATHARGVRPLQRALSRGDTVTDYVLSVLQGSLRRKFVPDINTEASNNYGAKEKKKTPQAHVYLLNKDEAKDNIRFDERLMWMYCY